MAEAVANGKVKSGRPPRFDSPEYEAWAASLRSEQAPLQADDSQAEDPQAVDEPLDLERGDTDSEAGEHGASWSWVLRAARAAKAKVTKLVPAVAGQATETEIGIGVEAGKPTGNTTLHAPGEQTVPRASMEQVKGWQRQLSLRFAGIADGATQARTLLLDKAKIATEGAKELQERYQEKLEGATEVGTRRIQDATELAKAAKDQMGHAVEAAKTGVLQVGSQIHGAASLTLQPMRLAQFGGIFMLGMFLISTSFSFLPVLMIAPQKFALLFAFGSVTMLSSFAVLKGPAAFAGELVQRSRLPLTLSYAIGLLGTLFATIILKSYILTAIFGILQAVALLYFCASYIPGGQTILNAFGSICSHCSRRAARAVIS